MHTHRTEHCSKLFWTQNSPPWNASLLNVSMLTLTAKQWWHFLTPQSPFHRHTQAVSQRGNARTWIVSFWRYGAAVMAPTHPSLQKKWHGSCYNKKKRRDFQIFLLPGTINTFLLASFTWNAFKDIFPFGRTNIFFFFPRLGYITLNNESEKLIMLIWFGHGPHFQVGLFPLLTIIPGMIVAYSGKYGSDLPHN